MKKLLTIFLTAMLVLTCGIYGYLAVTKTDNLLLSMPGSADSTVDWFDTMNANMILIDAGFNDVLAYDTTPVLKGNLDIATFNIEGVDTTEFGYVDGVTSDIQTQFNAKQPLDAGLTSISALTTAADKMIYTTALDTYAVTALTTAGRAILDDADNVAQLVTLGLTATATELNFVDGVTSAIQTQLDGKQSSLPIVDTTGIAKGSVDATKIVRLEVDGLTTGTTRVLTVPDKDLTLVGTVDKLSAFAATTSAELAGVISNETGSGLLVFQTSPTIILPVIKGTSASDLPTYSAEFLDADNWTSTDWTGSWAAGWTHTTGNVTVLSHDHAAVAATKYQITYTVSGRTAGTFSIGFGGRTSTDTSAALYATGAWGPTATTTGNLTITPTTDFDGTIVISIKSITSPSTPTSTYQSSNGTARIEIRANTGLYNTFIGEDAGEYNTTGDYNTFLGHGAGQDNTTGFNNMFIGEYAGKANTTGYHNIFVGRNAGRDNKVGFYNTFIGTDCGTYNTTASNNTFIGEGTGLKTTIGGANSFVGRGSGEENTTGGANSALGYFTLYYNTTGSYNSALGFNAGCYQANGTTPLTDPETSIYIGADSKGKDNSDSNSIVIGYNAIGLGANTIVLGNDSITQTNLKGKVAIGLNANTPTARLHLPAGTATASTAPIKLTSGTSLTTPEAGAIEFTTDAFYGTITTGPTRKTFAFLESPLFTTPSLGVATATSINAIPISKGVGSVATNTVVGIGAGVTDMTGSSNNSFFGNGAGATCAGGNNNTFIGTSAGNPTTGSSNTFIGSLAGYGTIGGTYNSALGESSGRGNTTGSNNVFMGYAAGRFHANGSTALTDAENSVYIGHTSRGKDNNDNNSIVIGYNAIGIGANTVVLGNDSITKTILKGNVMIGLNANTPTARLHLAAGTATASTAPIKLTSGTSLTTPEAGAIEFTTDAFYGTITTGPTRKTFAFLESPVFTGSISTPEKTPVNAVASQGTITMAGIATANETFVIDSQTFTWKAARAAAGEVTIGADAPAAVTNIVTAVTADLATVTAVDGAGDTVTITAVTKGVSGNSIVFTEASTNMTVDGAGTLGSTTAGVNGTVGVANEIAQDATYLYVCIATNTVADTNWRRIALGSAY